MKRECSCGRPTSGGWLCTGDRSCETTFRHALANVAAYWADLETVATKRARLGDSVATKGSVGKAQPLPVDARFLDTKQPAGAVTVGRASLSPATQLRWDTWNTVVAWCRTVMAQQPELAGPTCPDREGCLHLSCAAIRRRRWPRVRQLDLLVPGRATVPAMIHYLARQFRAITQESWCEDMFDEFRDLERRLTKLIDRGADRWYAGKCSVPDEDGVDCTAELYASTDRGTITCRACGITHDVAERREVLLEEAKNYVVTATEAATVLIAWTEYDGSVTKLVDRIRKWRDRETDPLEVRDVVSLKGKDRHLYRLGDIQERLVEAAQREQTRRMTTETGGARA